MPVMTDKIRYYWFDSIVKKTYTRENIKLTVNNKQI